MKINLKSHKIKKTTTKNKKHTQTFESSLFIGQNYFFIDGAQLYIIFQPLSYILKRLGNTVKIGSCKYEGLSVEKLITPTTTDMSLSPSIKCYRNSKFCLVFKGNC